MNWLFSILITTFSFNSFGQSFGYNGQYGQNGNSGRNGRDGNDIVVKSLGEPLNYNISGGDAGDGGQGEYGHSASSCQQPMNTTHNLEGADGGEGGMGGSGGRGGSGGDITVYYSQPETLQLVHVLSTPGNGGNGNWGGRGGEGCYCQVSTWKPEGATSSYYCSNGSRGRDGNMGSRGQSGTYGRVVLIPQLEPILPEKPAFSFDISLAETTSLSLSKNYWENRTGARQLFHQSSDISNHYLYFAGRDEFTYSFRWEAPRPISDFKGWRATVQIDQHAPKLYLPSGLWVDGETIQEGSHHIYVIKAIVTGSEFGQLSLTTPTGIGLEHTVTIQDTAGVSNMLRTKVNLRYMTVENGQYKDQFHADVPREALTIDAKSIRIAMGKIGIDEKHFALGSQVYIGLIITRGIGASDYQYSLGQYYSIKYTLEVGTLVELLEDASLYTGNQVVGSVKKGERYLINRIVGDWHSLKKSEGAEGTVVPGWVQSKYLKPVT